LAPASRRPLCSRIQHEIGNLNLSGAHILASSEQSAESRQQLRYGKGLREIVISAAIQTCNAILHCVPRGEHDYRHSRSGPPQFPANCKPIVAGDHNVEDDSVIIRDRRLVNGINAIARHIHSKRVLTQSFRDKARNTLIVFNQKDSQQAS
jgi:hypothetical protein